MRKIIAGLNMTLDGICDHTAMLADDEVHEHYSQALREAGMLVYGRITYQLMEDYWPGIVTHPTGNKSTDEFATLIHEIPKLVFSRTLDQVHWNQAQLATRSLSEELNYQRTLPGKDILVGSPSLIAAVLDQRIANEFHIMIHPVIQMEGMKLLKNISGRIELTLLDTKTFGCGAVMMYYSL